MNNHVCIKYDIDVEVHDSLKKLLGHYDNETLQKIVNVLNLRKEKNVNTI